MEKVFNKLVRDKIPEIIENNKEEAITKILSDEEYKIELLKKLKEETDEVLKASSKEEILEELSDTLEVIRCIAYSEGSNLEEIISLMEIKKEKRGGFSNKIFLIKTL